MILIDNPSVFFFLLRRDVLIFNMLVSEVLFPSPHMYHVHSSFISFESCPCKNPRILCCAILADNEGELLI